METELIHLVKSYLTTHQRLTLLLKSHRVDESQLTLLAYKETYSTFIELSHKIQLGGHDVCAYYARTIQAWFDGWRIYTLKYRQFQKRDHLKSAEKCENMMSDCVYEFNLYFEKVFSKLPTNNN